MIMENVENYLKSKIIITDYKNASSEYRNKLLLALYLSM